MATLIPRDLIAAEVDLHARQAIGFAVGAAALLALLSAVGIIYQGRARAQMRRIAFSDPVTGGYNNARFLWDCFFSLIVRCFLPPERKNCETTYLPVDL